MSVNKLVCFGLGYSAQVVVRRLMAKGWETVGTTRSEKTVQTLREDGFNALLYSGEQRSDAVGAELAQATHVLLSIAPGAKGDPVLAHHADDLAQAPHLQWIGYLSTVGVYGDHGGAWVDEHTTLNPKSERSIQRVAAEKAWLEFGERTGKPVHVFRLSGIYGPGRGPFENVRAGKGRRIVKPGQVFNRIHVEDIANALEASIARPRAGAIYNVTDDEPAPPQDVVKYACTLLGQEPPPEVAFDDADLTPMGQSFYGENKRVSNALIKEELGVEFAFPTYRQGLEVLARSVG